MSQEQQHRPWQKTAVYDLGGEPLAVGCQDVQVDAQIEDDADQLHTAPAVSCMAHAHACTLMTLQLDKKPRIHRD